MTRTEHIAALREHLAARKNYHWQCDRGAIVLRGPAARGQCLGPRGRETPQLDFEEFMRFSEEEPVLTRDLLFAMARILSSRLRNTTFRMRR